MISKNILHIAKQLNNFTIKGFGIKLNQGGPINKVEIGDYFENTRTYTQKDINQFADLVGDRSPIHLDPEYAATTIFKKPIVYGFQTGAMFSNLIGNNLPGAIYLNQTLNFTAPVYIDEEVQTIVEIVNINLKSKKLILKTSVRKVKQNKIAIDGEAHIYYKDIKNIFQE